MGFDEGELLRDRESAATRQRTLPGQLHLAHSGSRPSMRRAADQPDLAAALPEPYRGGCRRGRAPGAGRRSTRSSRPCRWCSCSRWAQGLLVLYSALVATEDERRREAAIMRVYGASRSPGHRQPARGVSGDGVAGGHPRHRGRRGHRAAAGAAGLRTRPAAEHGLVDRGPLAGVLLLSLNAWLSARKVLSASPALTLREDA